MAGLALPLKKKLPNNSSLVIETQCRDKDIWLNDILITQILF